MRPVLLLLALNVACHDDGDDTVAVDSFDSDATRAETNATESDPPRGLRDEPVAAAGPAQDPELLPDDPPLVAWQHPITDEVWIAEVDPVTGQWLPADGKGLRLGRAAAIDGTRQRPPTYNGPEWGTDAGGPSVFFTAVDDAGVHQVAGWRRGDGRLRRLTEGGATHRSGAIPQQAPGAERLGFFYFLDALEDLRLAWRRVGDAEDSPLPASPAVDPVPRWIPGEDAIATLAQVEAGGPTQVVRYDLATRALTPLTTDAGHKYDPFFVDDPASGERLMVASVADALPTDLQTLVSSRIAVYRLRDGAWARSHELSVDDVAGAPHAHTSVEPFVARGTAWVSFVAGTGTRRGGPSHVWVARVDGSELLRLTDGDGVTRSDPEVLVVADGDDALLYYTTPGPDRRQRVRVIRDFLPR